MSSVRVQLRVCRTCSARRLWPRTKRHLHTDTATFQRLIEVGRLEAVKTEEYQPGQFFLHRAFGYRGVVLFSWKARLYDRDRHGGNLKPTGQDRDTAVYEQLKTLKPENLTYYQALVDNRDCPFIRSQPEAITYLAEDNNLFLYSVAGLDYASHEDVLPYTPSEQDPFRHDLFQQLLASTGNQDGTLEYVPRDTLVKAWQEKNYSWLELTDVHRETTHGVRVTVIPFYLGYKPSHQPSNKSIIHWWRYSIRLENLTGEKIQLRYRQWRIYGQSGSLETVNGRGVVGQEPFLSTRQPVFQYSSHVSLQSPSGHMWGSFRMERQDGRTFDVRVPPFTLASESNSNSNNNNKKKPD